MDRKEARLQKKRLWGMGYRYLLAVLLSLSNLFLFYLVFTPLTVFPSYFLLKLIYPAVLSGNVILINDFVILLNGACIAGSAYLLLALLNLTTPGMKPLKRLGIFFLGAAALLLFNIVRIFVFTILLVNGVAFYDLMHTLVWYVLSVLVVVMIWLYTIRKFRIAGIPIFSDIMYLKSLTKKK
jgi:hypothetical protein